MHTATLTQQGTVITGALATDLDAEIAHPFPVAEITVIGNGISANPQIVQEMVEKTKQHSLLLGMSMSQIQLFFMFLKRKT